VADKTGGKEDKKKKKQKSGQSTRRPYVLSCSHVTIPPLPHWLEKSPPAAHNVTPVKLSGTRLLVLQHCPERVVGWDALARAAAILCGRLAVPECEANEEALAHLVVTLGHGLESLLLVVNLLVLCHVGLVCEVIKVSGVRLRVQLWDKGCAGLAESVPVDFGKVVMSVNIVNIREPARSRVDGSIITG
jgi:hypothetical protein